MEAMLWCLIPAPLLSASLPQVQSGDKVTFTDPTTAAARCIAEMKRRERPDLVVLLSHNGGRRGPPPARGRAVPLPAWNCCVAHSDRTVSRPPAVCAPFVGGAAGATIHFTAQHLAAAPQAISTTWKLPRS